MIGILNPHGFPYLAGESGQPALVAAEGMHAPPVLGTPLRQPTGQLQRQKLSFTQTCNPGNQRRVESFLAHLAGNVMLFFQLAFFAA